VKKVTPFSPFLFLFSLLSYLFIKSLDMKNILLTKEEFIEIIDERLEKRNLIIPNKKKESDEIELLTRLQIPVKLTTPNRFKLTT
jgi:hypothetical protein